MKTKYLTNFFFFFFFFRFSQKEDNQHNFLGKGGFGEVYKGVWQGQEIAVKKLRKEKLYAPDGTISNYINTFITELKVMHQFPADNILRLMGFSYSEDMTTDPCLVYQFMANGSLSDRLRMRNNKPPLTWLQRAQIVRGTAKGLVYLHSKKPPIIHGDIKPANILLDQHLEAKIGDFGLARGGTTDPTKSFRSVSQVHGTSWYLPDDYKRSNCLCPKVDVFCFGISLFEVVTGNTRNFNYVLHMHQSFCKRCNFD